MADLRLAIKSRTPWTPARPYRLEDAEKSEPEPENFGSRKAARQAFISVSLASRAEQ